MSVLAVVLGWMLAHDILYTYIAPYVSSTGIDARVDVVLLTFGTAAPAGIWLTGALVDRALRALVLGSLVAFAIVALALTFAGAVPAVFYGAMVVWGLTFGGASTQLNTASADAAGENTGIAAAMISTTWNLAIFAAGVAGALLLATAGAGSFPWALLTAIAAALLIASRARRTAFTAGPRSADRS